MSVLIFGIIINYEVEYKKAIQGVSTEIEVRSIIDSKFLRYYVAKIWVGDPENRIQIDTESLSKFDFQFLDAIRDVERDMYSGKNALLKNVIDFFLDYDIKSNKNISHDEQVKQIEARKNNFETTSERLVAIIQNRLNLGKDKILSYAKEVGALFDNYEPDFEGDITENEIYSILQLIVKQKTGISIPITHNGLGYNNLIYMSLLLAKMQVDSDGNYLDSNAKVFPILAIEEPEAHLHPTMQLQLVKFLKANLKDRKVRQIFVTSHSTHITSSAELDDIICLYKINDETKVSYPGKVFYQLNSSSKLEEKLESKKYVQRFLDATKSNMLFSEKIIFVEGISEQLLIPVLAEYMGKSLEDYHVSVINIGGRYFEHFLYLFDCNKDYTLRRKVACITDRDPVRRLKNDTKFKKCYPYELNIDLDNYEYKTNSIMEKYEGNKHPTIRAFLQDSIYGKTLEYQLAFENETNELLITPSLENKEEIKRLMEMIKLNKPVRDILNALGEGKENERIKNSILRLNDEKLWTDDKKKKAIIASRYLNCVNKGENALELATILKDNLSKKGTESYIDFNVPSYIKKAIEWVCEDI